MDILNTEFTAQIVAAAAGIEPKQVADWANKGLIVGQIGGGGVQGKVRRYSFFNLIEVACAVELMAAGVSSPRDAFQIAREYAHSGEAEVGWSGEPRNAPERLPGLPYHHLKGTTYLLVSGSKSLIGAGNLDLLLKSIGSPRGFIGLDLTAIFVRTALAIGGSPWAMLDEAYAVGVAP